jgi:hypothetical protein
VPSVQLEHEGAQRLRCFFPADDTAVTALGRLSGGTGSKTQSYFAMHMVYPIPN